VLRNSQYFNLVPVSDGDSTVVLAVTGYNPHKIEVGQKIYIKTNKDQHGNTETKFIIERTNKENLSVYRQDLGTYIFRNWRFVGSEWQRQGYINSSYRKEPKIKSSILRNHFREVQRGELLDIQTTSNDNYDHYKHFSQSLIPKEFLFKMFEGETLMFLGSEMKPLKHEDYHTQTHNTVALKKMWKSENFLHMNFLIGQRKIAYSELDFLYGDLFVDSFCYNRGKLYTNKNKKAK
jgi:hypothetical protein